MSHHIDTCNRLVTGLGILRQSPERCKLSLTLNPVYFLNTIERNCIKLGLLENYYYQLLALAYMIFKPWI